MYPITRMVDQQGAMTCRCHVWHRCSCTAMTALYGRPVASIPTGARHPTHGGHVTLLATLCLLIMIINLCKQCRSNAAFEPAQDGGSAMHGQNTDPFSENWPIRDDIRQAQLGLCTVYWAYVRGYVISSSLQMILQSHSIPATERQNHFMYHSCYRL